MFKNIIISILAATVLAQTGFFQPENMVQAVVLPVVWYFVFVVSLTWIDCQRMAQKERRKADVKRSIEKSPTRCGHDTTTDGRQAGD